MNKRFLFLLLLAFSVSIFFVVLLLMGRSQKLRPLPTFFVPTPTPASTSRGLPTVPLKVLSISPLNGATGADPNQQIIVTFNQPVATTSVRFSIFPEINYAMYSRLNSIIVVPSDLYQESISYTYSLFTTEASPLLVASFSAGISQSPAVPLVGRYPDLDIVADVAQRKNFPDVFLAGYTPYKTGVFSVDSTFSSSPSGHYVFILSPKTDSAKQGFLSWLKALGFDQDQIGRLEVLYQ